MKRCEPSIRTEAPADVHVRRLLDPVADAHVRALQADVADVVSGAGVDASGDVDVCLGRYDDPARFENRPDDTEMPICASPDDVMVIVAGGPGKHSAIVPTFGATRSVTVRIDA